MINKRKNNVTALRVKWLSPTNLKPSRLKITQLNNQETVTIPSDYTDDQMGNILNAVDDVESYSKIVDNTQQSTIDYMINFKSDHIFTNVIKILKKGI